MTGEDPDPGFRFVPEDRVDAGWLSCRRVRHGDATALYQSVMASIDHLSPWMPWAAGYTRQMSEDFVARNAPASPRSPVTDAPYLACDHDGQMLGVCGLHARAGEGVMEIGYWVDFGHIRRGVATLAAAAMTEVAFMMAAVKAVEIHHDQANLASRGVPERLGYRHVATVASEPQAPAETGVEWQWRLTRDEWPSSDAGRLLGEARAAS